MVLDFFRFWVFGHSSLCCPGNNVNGVRIQPMIFPGQLCFHVDRGKTRKPTTGAPRVRTLPGRPQSRRTRAKQKEGCQ